jgi:hypothetical protein
MRLNGVVAAQPASDTMGIARQTSACSCLELAKGLTLPVLHICLRIDCAPVRQA